VTLKRLSSSSRIPGICGISGILVLRFLFFPQSSFMIFWTLMVILMELGV